jgi:uncharacterized protein YjbI with pentapeptide repeats
MSVELRTTVRWIGVLVIAAVAVAVIVVLYGPVTDLIARHDVGAIAGTERATALRIARDAARGRLITTFAGVFAAGALWFTARNYLLARQGQVTDRYTKAIEQLGSKKLDVRLGAIYALERIARDSAPDHPTVMEVLAAFVREHSLERWPPSGDDETTASPKATRPDVQDVQAAAPPGAVSPDAVAAAFNRASPHVRDIVLYGATRPDVQAAVTVIGRRDIRRDRQRIDLTGAVLRSANLTGANLAGSLLSGANLIRTNLRNADLSRADLSYADLTSAKLDDTNFSRANLGQANLTTTVSNDLDLTRAILIGANLTNVVLNRPNFTGAALDHADLTGAHIHDANFTDAGLTDAKLSGVTFDDAEFHKARWPQDSPVPDGWARDESGRLRRNST